MAGSHHGADDLLVLALAAGKEVAAAAEEAGMSLRTAYRRKAEPTFAARVAACRAEMLDQVVGRLSSAATRAVEALVRNLDAERDSTQVAAARVVLDALLKTREVAELEQRLAALEGRAAT